MKRKTEERLIAEAYKNPKFKGKQIVVAGNEARILSTKNKKERIKLLTSLVKKYPQSIPTIAFIPKENTLILIL